MSNGQMSLLKLFRRTLKISKTFPSRRKDLDKPQASSPEDLLYPLFPSPEAPPLEAEQGEGEGGEEMEEEGEVAEGGGAVPLTALPCPPRTQA